MTYSYPLNLLYQTQPTPRLVSFEVNNMLSIARSLARVSSYFGAALLVVVLTLGILTGLDILITPKPMGNCYDPPNGCQ